MIVVCPCGKKLNVNDAVAGRKVRCPKCQEVFVARDEAHDKDENIISAKDRKRERDEEKGFSDDEPRRSRRGAVEEEENEDEGPPEKSKGGTPAWRLWVSIGVLVVLLGVGVFVFLRFLQPLGTVEFEFTTDNLDIAIDGKIHHLDIGFNKIAIDVQPGQHEIKITKTGFQTVTRQVTIKSGEKEALAIDLKRNPR